MCIIVKNQIQLSSAYNLILKLKVTNMENNLIKKIAFVVILFTTQFLSGCQTTTINLPPATVHSSTTNDVTAYKYLIGAGDVVNIFVWRNPEVSGTFTVRPDGMITTSLVEDIEVLGKTPTELARTIEGILSTYIKEPVVTVTVNTFNGPFSEQVRVIGEAASPKAINFTQRMTLLDVMIDVGGLTEFANGNRAKLVRVVEGEQKQYDIYIEDLIKNGDISANVDILPGDIIVIPETWF